MQIEGTSNKLCRVEVYVKNHFKPETHLQTTCFVYFKDQNNGLYRKINISFQNSYCFNTSLESSLKILQTLIKGQYVNMDWKRIITILILKSGGVL